MSKMGYSSSSKNGRLGLQIWDVFIQYNQLNPKIQGKNFIKRDIYTNMNIEQTSNIILHPTYTVNNFFVESMICQAHHYIMCQ